MMGGMNIVAAYAALVGFCGMALFQLALALGAPLGGFAWGGQVKRLPGALRIGSALSALLFLCGVLVLLQVLGHIAAFVGAGLLQGAMWVFATLFAFSTLANAMSKSRGEKLLMTPVAAVLCLASFVVASGLS